MLPSVSEQRLAQAHTHTACELAAPTYLHVRVYTELKTSIAVYSLFWVKDIYVIPPNHSRSLHVGNFKVSVAYTVTLNIQTKLSKKNKQRRFLPIQVLSIYMDKTKQNKNK